MNNAALDGVTVIFVIIVIIAYIFIIMTQHKNQIATPELQRLNVLTARTALFLPFYAVFMWFSLLAPAALPAFGIFLAFMEGYSFYCFFTLLVTNLGGPVATVEFLKEANRPLVCCSCFCPSDMVAFYKKTTWAMFHFLFTRTGITVVSAIAFYSGTNAGRVLFIVLNLLATVLLFYCLVHLVNLCKSLSSLYFTFLLFPAYLFFVFLNFFTY